MRISDWSSDVCSSDLPLDYRVPHGSEAPLGSVVVVPLGPRRMGGVVWEDASFGAPEAVGDNRLRNLYEVVPVPPVPAPLRKLVEWTDRKSTRLNSSH